MEVRHIPACHFLFSNKGLQVHKCRASPSYCGGRGAGLRPIRLFSMACCHRQGQGQPGRSDGSEMCVFLGAFKKERPFSRPQPEAVWPSRSCAGLDWREMCPLPCSGNCRLQFLQEGHTSPWAAFALFLLADDVLRVQGLGSWLPTAGQIDPHLHSFPGI